MEEYLIIMRLDIMTKETPPSPEQLEGYMKLYQDWVSGIAAQNKFVGGTGLSKEGRLIKSGNIVTDGPFAEVKEYIAGFIRVKAKNLDDAFSLAKGCPILNGPGNSVEVRQVSTAHNA